VPPLIKVLKDKSWVVRRDATEALGKIGDTSALTPLTEALRDKDGNVRVYAAEALKKLQE